MTLGGNVTLLDSERRDADNPPTGDIAEDKWNLFARYEWGRYGVEYRVRHNGEEDAVLEPGDPIPLAGPTLPSFTVHGLGAFADLGAVGRVQHRLGLQIENLSDELYAEFTNIASFRPQPKRNFVLTYRLSLR